MDLETINIEDNKTQNTNSNTILNTNKLIIPKVQLPAVDKPKEKKKNKKEKKKQEKENKREKTKDKQKENKAKEDKQKENKPKTKEPKLYRVFFDNNGYSYHFEIVFAFIEYFNKKYRDQVKFFFLPKFINQTRKQILKNYTFFDQRIRIKEPEKYDLRIVLTAYQKRDFDQMEKLKNDKKILLISHLHHPDLDDFKNLIYLTPVIQKQKYLIPASFPFPKVKPNFDKPPVFLIQGNIEEARRNYRSLLAIFEKNQEHDFRIMILGRGDLPRYLEPFKNKIILRANLDDLNYHQAIQEATFILPIVDHTFKHEYFKKKLTSSISYGLGFGLRFVIYSKLAELYELNDQYVYRAHKNKKDVDILPAFRQALNDFRHKTLKPIPEVKRLHNLTI